MLPTILDALAIEKLLPQVNVQSALRDMFLELAHGKAAQPPQTLTLFPSGNGDFINYQGVLEKHKVFGAKLSPYIAGNDQAIVTAWTCLMSMETGQPLLLCDAAQLTTERTAGTSALAVDLLSKADSKVLAIIGSGSIAAAHWRHVEGLRNWEQIRLWSPNLKDNQKKQEDWRTLCPSVEFSESAQSAIQNADVILLCTSSGTPVIDTTRVNNGSLVTSISTNVAQAHEVPPQFLNSAQVYCDYRATTPEKAGEMVIAEQDYGWSTNDLRGDLPELVSGNAALPDGAAPLFFRSLGLGLEDISIAYEIFLANQNREPS